MRVCWTAHIRRGHLQKERIERPQEWCGPVDACILVSAASLPAGFMPSLCHKAESGELPTRKRHGRLWALVRFKHREHRVKPALGLRDAVQTRLFFFK